MSGSYGFTLNYVVKGLGYMGHSDIVTSASGSMLVTNFNNNPYAVLPLNRGGQIPTRIIKNFKTSYSDMGINNGIVISPTPLDVDSTELIRHEGIELLTFDTVIDKLVEEELQVSEIKSGLIRVRDESLGEPYDRASQYFEWISRVESARTNDEKKKSLENFILFFVQDLGLTDPKLNVRGPSSEIDVTAKNNRQVGYWRDFSHYVLFECKNWDKKVGSDEIRDFKGKVSNANTRFFIAWKGISGRDELEGAKLEIIKANAQGKQIMVLEGNDFLRIASGSDPETIIGNKYYALLHDKVL